MRGSGQNPQESIRITDKCRHFLGKIENGKIYIYCRRCKRCIPITWDGKEFTEAAQKEGQEKSVFSFELKI